MILVNNVAERRTKQKCWNVVILCIKLQQSVTILYDKNPSIYNCGTSKGIVAPPTLDMEWLACGWILGLLLDGLDRSFGGTEPKTGLIPVKLNPAQENLGVKKTNHQIPRT